MFLEKEKLVVADQCRGVLGVGVGGIYVGEWWGVLGKKMALLQYKASQNRLAPCALVASRACSG